MYNPLVRQDTMERLIGLYSPVPRSGKTFTATILAHNGFQPLSFAEPIKHMAVEFFMSLGYSRDKSLSLAWISKEEIIPEIGKTSRHVLQTLGTQWGRNWIGEDIWVKSLCLRATKFNRVIVDDVRFENEANAIKEMGGEMWCIKRPSMSMNFQHESEGALDEWGNFDHTIINDGTLKDFREKIDRRI